MNSIKCFTSFTINIHFSINLQLSLIDLDKISENGRNVYEWNQIKQTINQYSKLISIEHTRMNEVDRHFEDLEYLNNINVQYSEILSNVTERGYSKLYPLELIMDVRFGRSTFIHFESFHYYFALSMNMNHYLSQQVHHNRV